MSRVVIVAAIVSAFAISASAGSEEDDRIPYGDTQEFTKRMTTLGAKCEIVGDIMCRFDLGNDLRFLVVMGSHGGFNLSFDSKALRDADVYMKYGEVAAILPYESTNAAKVFKIPAELSQLCKQHGYTEKSSVDMTVCSLSIVMTQDGKITRNMTQESTEALEGVGSDDFDPSKLIIPPPTSGTVVQLTEISGSVNQLTFGWIDASRAR